MEIHKANLSDLYDMTINGVEFLKFIHGDNKRIDKSHVCLVLKNMISNGIIFVAKQEEFMGAIGGVINEDLWIPGEYQLTELFWWVTERYRGSSTALRLLNTWIDYGKNNKDINRIVMAKESISPLNDKVYTKRGFKLREESYVMEV